MLEVIRWGLGFQKTLKAHTDLDDDYLNSTLEAPGVSINFGNASLRKQLKRDVFEASQAMSSTSHLYNWFEDQAPLLHPIFTVTQKKKKTFYNSTFLP